MIARNKWPSCAGDRTYAPLVRLESPESGSCSRFLPCSFTRMGLPTLYDNRYYGFPEDADDGALVFDLGQNSTWHYHTFPDDTEGVLRHVPTGLTFVTVPVPRNEPPEVELL